ncbi:ComEA family DNA-binding protein [Candidatus Symbiobacter mobilis]|uniref:Competence protein ComEA n=1 Tax=Candidatus Symbiobacter mobilis CR TaxID=946483 RepID=U5NA08_9BURK|nr:helix-hairpin-helix domain-containing protein [Candidatus Symbiobacter mobilis]AGX87024.1 competence protein ComEA [Candidatus Symbiobacter mobilis CR]
MMARNTFFLLSSSLVCAVCFAGLDINKASEAELDSIKGIGPGTSSKILAERSKAPFRDWADLIDRVQGIAQIKAARFSAEGITVNGVPYYATPPSPMASQP